MRMVAFVLTAKTSILFTQGLPALPVVRPDRTR